MAKQVVMPALGMAQETGTLLVWHKQAGDAVQKGELLMTVATDKTEVEIEANASGTLAQVTANLGDEVPVGQVIALILTAEEVAAGVAPVTTPIPLSGAIAPIPAAVASATPVAARLAADHQVDLRSIKASSGGKIQKEDVLAFVAQRDKITVATAAAPLGRILASPKARRLAQEAQLDLATLNGSGPDGAILAADVVAHAAEQASDISPLSITATPTPPLPYAPVALPVSRLWRIMAQRLQQSWTTVPHFYLTYEANASQLMRWRTQIQARTQSKITYTDLLIKVVAVALQGHPRLNASWRNEEIVPNAAINIGLAVAVEEGLLVPVLAQADKLGVTEIATRRADLVARAQAGKLTPADLDNGTFTISNLGMYGVDSFNAIVNPPQAAILAVARIADKVVPINGQPAVQPITTLTLSCDHRVVDGARAAQFMQTVVRYIEDPLAILD